jgi:signal transduction histidine kinase
MKFTSPGGRFGIELIGSESEKQVHITVWDTGIGIKAEDLPRLFQPFIQLDARLARQYSGTGLGLALVRRLTELHGGSVEVKSVPGQGSRFTVSLPWSG